MKSFIVAACIVACAYAAVSDEKDAQVVRSVYDLSPEGGYQYGFDTSNGISGQASAILKNAGQIDAALEVSGDSTYTNPEGQVIKLTYIADENGYRAVGDHLPTPPAPEPIPEYIARAIEYAAAHPYTEKN